MLACVQLNLLKNADLLVSSMQLKRIQLSGFKSFVDLIQIPVLGGVNAVVGPNGCGKSNIVDAIRWVSGEMSAKQLRGQSMSDVIFNGSSGRKPAGQATVELIFDNADGRISGEYAGFSEISIRREVVRDAQSDYFINGVSARRRDLIDLFLGTGLGPHSYAIIEQGMINQLIEAKPEELRSHLEEVAGISKYRERRRETENRIRHTQDNLDRLNDLREELSKQLRHLKRQANAAERYQLLKQEQRLVNAQMKVLQWQLLDHQLKEKNKKIEEQALLSEVQLTKQRDIEKRIEKLRLEIDTIMDEKNDVQKKFYSLSSDVARLEQQIQYKREQIQQWKQELTESESLFQELNDNSDAQANQIGQLTETIAQWKPQAPTLQADYHRADSLLKTAEETMRTVENQWETLQTQLSQTISAFEVEKNNIQHYEAQIQQCHDRRAQIEKQLSELPLNNASSDIEPLSTQAATLKENIQLLNDSFSNASQQIAQKREACEKMQMQLTHTQQTLQKQEARFASLHALQQSTLQDQSAKTLPWIEKYALKNNPQLGKLIHVDSGWELAVEAVLGNYFHAICVNQLDQFTDALNEFLEGRLTLLSEEKSLAEKQFTQKTILSIMKTDFSFPAWLHHVYIAHDLDEALQQRPHLQYFESIVTKTGIWIGVNWIRITRKKNDEQHFLIREKELRVLQKTIEIQKKQVDQEEAALTLLRSQLVSVETTRDAKHEALQKLNTEFVEIQAKLNVKQSHLNELTQQHKYGLEEIQEIHEQMNRYQINLTNAKASVSRYGATQTDQVTQREKLLAEKNKAVSVLTTARNEAQLKKQHMDEWSIRLSSHENQLSVLKQTVASNQKQLVQLTERRAALHAYLNEADAPIQQYSAELQVALSEHTDIELKLQNAEERFQSHQHQLKQWESEHDAIVKYIAVLREEQEQIRMQRQEITVRQTTLQEQLTESQFDLQTMIRELPTEANLFEWETRSQQLHTSIDRLGLINLAAIDEHQTISERKNYLDQQYQDLTEALEVLQNAIRKIDKETRQLFQDTYDKVNQHFQTLFPQVFGGGQASLALTEDNLLTTGILVRAQPPGKRNTTIHMLSGGEKTLTAIALMFAMFQLNPAPFCVLDEVDAALDDLNISRFCHLLKTMSREIQFLIISHNKNTVQAAEHLMGVTMQEPGVSRIVSVNMQQAVEMAEV